MNVQYAKLGKKILNTESMIVRLPPLLYTNDLKDKIDNDKYTINSCAKTDFICLSCNRVIKNKVNRYGLKCTRSNIQV